MGQLKTVENVEQQNCLGSRSVKMISEKDLMGCKSFIQKVLVFLATLDTDSVVGVMSRAGSTAMWRTLTSRPTFSVLPPPNRHMKGRP